MALKTYSGSCHCGAVQFQADIDLSRGTTRCNCSICSKARAWFVMVSGDHFRLRKGEDAMADYQWTPAGKSRPNLHYRFCTTCGVRVFATGQDPKGGPMYAIAVATLEGADPDELARSVKYLDGRHDQFNQAPPENSASL
jgi:hypothetical protein